MIARIICWLYGHKRGKRVSVPVTREIPAAKGLVATDAMGFSGTIRRATLTQNEIMLQCPRCKATWTRKVKA